MRFVTFIIMLLAGTVASAQEKKPANYDGSSVSTKYALAGSTIRVLEVVSVEPDCTPHKMVHRVVKAPQHGKLEVAAAEGFGHWKDGPRAQCVGKRLPSLNGTYTPNQSYEGEDHVEITVYSDSGWRHRYQITIKVEK